MVGFQSMPRLVRADVSNNFGFEIPLKAVCNVEYLRFYLEERLFQEKSQKDCVVSILLLKNVTDIFMFCLYNSCIQECFHVFHNLIHLELNFGSHIKWHLVFEMLEHCPKLQTFVLHKLSPFLSSPPEIWSCPPSVPKCIASQFRKCTILNYKGKECELRFAKYIMQNSRALQAITINDTYSSNPQDKLEMLQKLAMCPRSSVTCKLLFK
ncbi:putative FBD-associated F-box protein [Spatholobus suberectus]|nr:putative FBD-associated F-box protein [Spatholobus suberectus]